LAVGKVALTALQARTGWCRLGSREGVAGGLAVVSGVMSAWQSGAAEVVALQSQERRRWWLCSHRSGAGGFAVTSGGGGGFAVTGAVLVALQSRAAAVAALQA
jgi:hypothetical protein